MDLLTNDLTLHYTLNYTLNIDKIMIFILVFCTIHFAKKNYRKNKQLDELIKNNNITHVNLIEQTIETEKFKKELATPEFNMKKVKESEEIEAFLYKRLDSIFNSFIFTKEVLLTFKKYGSIAEATKKELRNSFINYVEFQLTESEKELFKSRYKFTQFKFLIVDYFNIKSTKLELLIIQKIEMKEDEFRDFKLIESLFSGLSNKDVQDILSSFTDSEPKQKIKDE